MSTVAVAIRDRFVAKLKTLSFFTGFNFSTDKSVQIQPETVPFAGVYIIEETDVADGDDNVGSVRFKTFVRYGFSVIVQNNSSTEAEKKLDLAVQGIDELLRDPKIYNWYGPENEAKIQAYTRKGRSHHFGSIGAENEIPIAELRYDLTCDLGVIHYLPDVPDELRTVHVETKWPIGGDPLSTQQVSASYDIETE